MIWDVPAARPFKVALPEPALMFGVIDSTVAAFSSLDEKEMLTPPIGWLN